MDTSRLFTAEQQWDLLIGSLYIWINPSCRFFIYLDQLSSALSPPTPSYPSPTSTLRKCDFLLHFSHPHLKHIQDCSRSLGACFEYTKYGSPHGYCARLPLIGKIILRNNLMNGFTYRAYYAQVETGWYFKI